MVQEVTAPMQPYLEAIHIVKDNNGDATTTILN
jgi:hypothetical protein